MNTRRVAVLGSTGSIGVQALEIIDSRPDLELYSILCNRSIELLSEQKERYHPSIVAAVDGSVEIPQGTVSGLSALQEAVAGADIVLNAIVGSAGLEASILCQKLDIPIALANKESLVIGGELLRTHLYAGKIIPVDSEHSTIFRCLQSQVRPVRSITLTASGGPTRKIPIYEIYEATPDQILEHPTWNMGRRITVDSATMVNKAFEVIEAGWLFGEVPIDAVIHPQSIVHSLVRLEDGSWKALLGLPDMKIPIQYALLWPHGQLSEIASDAPDDWGILEFMEMDRKRYPAFDVVVAAGRTGKTAPAAANAADEVAVDAFLKGNISFGAIAQVIEEVLTLHEPFELGCVQDVLDADMEAREAAMRIVRDLC